MGGWGWGGPGHKLLSFMGTSLFSLVHKTTRVCKSQVRTREAECSGRFALENRADNSYRVDSPQGHSVPHNSFLGSSSYRSICHEAQQSTSSFHISFSRSVGMGSGCDVPVMG